MKTTKEVLEDIEFERVLRETYLSTQSIKTSEAEWGGKIIGSHGSNHSRGVMILLKPKLDVDIKEIALGRDLGIVPQATQYTHNI